MCECSFIDFLWNWLFSCDSWNKNHFSINLAKISKNWLCRKNFKEYNSLLVTKLKNKLCNKLLSFYWQKYSCLCWKGVLYPTHKYFTYIKAFCSEIFKGLYTFRKTPINWIKLTLFCTLHYKENLCYIQYFDPNDSQNFNFFSLICSEFGLFEDFFCE